MRILSQRLFVFAAITSGLLLAPFATGAGMDGDIELRGEVMGLGAPCVQFRIDGGETISLQGASPQDFQEGMHLAVTGQWLRISNCMQGRAFRVVRHEAL
jgi:hypothetical protein